MILGSAFLVAGFSVVLALDFLDFLDFFGFGYWGWLFGAAGGRSG